MTDFLREWAKYYRFNFFFTLILCVLLVYLMLVVWFDQSWASAEWAILPIAFVLSLIVWGRLRVFNSSFEGLIDRYYVQGNCYLLVLSKDGQEFTEEVNLDQYEIAEIGDYVKKEPKTFGYQVIPASDSTDDT